MSFLGDILFLALTSAGKKEKKSSLARAMFVMDLLDDSQKTKVDESNEHEDFYMTENFVDKQK